jgi:hypothetical protein
VAYISGLENSGDVTTSTEIEALYVVDKSIPYQPNLLIIAIIFILFLGWFLFVIFGGIGMIALPMDLIIDYIHR